MGKTERFDKNAQIESRPRYAQHHAGQPLSHPAVTLQFGACPLDFVKKRTVLARPLTLNTRR